MASGVVWAVYRVVVLEWSAETASLEPTVEDWVRSKLVAGRSRGVCSSRSALQAEVYWAAAMKVVLDGTCGPGSSNSFSLTWSYAHYCVAESLIST